MEKVNYKELGTFLQLCEKIEHCFEFTFPELFETYFQNRLHGRYHVWNVLKWSMLIADLMKRYECPDYNNIDFKNFIAANLLHDIAGLQILKDERVDHHIKSEPYIKKIINYAVENSIEVFDPQKVFIIARAHRLRNVFPPHSICEEIIALADGLDESIHRLYIGNKGKRPFYDENLPIEHRMKVVKRRNLDDEGISREDSRNDALMFMIDSLVRNSLDFNPWKLVLSKSQSEQLRISDDCYAQIGKKYFERNYKQLCEILKFENKPFLLSFIHDLIGQVAKDDNFKILRTYQISNSA